MTALYMLDTNMVSYIARGRSAAARTMLLQLGRNEVACVSSITEAEVLYGLEKRPEARALRLAMEGFLSRLQVLPFGRDEASAYGAVRAALESEGKALGNLDMLIAAHAVAVGAILVTNDRAFLHVRNLRETVNWATDL